MMKFMDEIWSMKNDNFNDLFLDVIECWIVVYVKNFCSLFNFYSIIVKYIFVFMVFNVYF